VGLNLNGTMINSEAPAVLRDFYTKVLGEPAFEEGEFVGWSAGVGFLVVGPHSDVKGTNEMPGRIMLNFETTDVQGEFDRIKGLGVRVVQEPYQPGPGDDTMWMATFADPDGNYFQLVTPMEP